MAVLWFTGFEGGAGLQEPFSTVTGAGVTVGAGYARNGSYGCRLLAPAESYGVGHMQACANDDGAIDAGFADDTRIHFYLKIVTLPPASEREMILFSYRGGCNVGLTLVLEDDGALSLYEVDKNLLTTNFLGTSSSTYNDGAWHAIQIKDDYVVGPPTHAYELIVDTVSEVSGTTNNLGTNAVTTLYFGKFVTAFDSSYDVYVDDVVITSDAYADYPYSIERFLPNENGTYTAWTGTFMDVDELPPNDDVDYVISDVSNARESFLCENSAGGSAGKSIAAVKFNYVVKCTYAGDQTKFFIRDSGGTNRDTASAVTLTFAYIAYATLWTTNPATSAVWQASEIDLTEIGILCKDPEIYATRCTAMQIHVLYSGAEAVTASSVLSLVADQLSPDTGEAGGYDADLRCLLPDIDMGDPTRVKVLTSVEVIYESLREIPISIEVFRRKPLTDPGTASESVSLTTQAAQAEEPGVWWGNAAPVWGTASFSTYKIYSAKANFSMVQGKSFNVGLKATADLTPLRILGIMFEFDVEGPWKGSGTDAV